MSLKDNLLKFMREREIKIKELAKLTDISEPTLKRLRTSNDSNPTLDILIRLSKALEVQVSDLIQNNKDNLTFYQGNAINLPPDKDEFTLIFTKDTFDFEKGAKAIFRRYNPGDSITKYIIHKDGRIMEKIDAKEMKFRDPLLNIYSLDADFILAFIIKELYEVNYV